MSSLWARRGLEEGSEGAEEKGRSVELFFPEHEEQAIEHFLTLVREEGLDLEQERIPEQDWNKKWEENFQPVFIGDRLVIRAPFHPTYEHFPYRIEVMPERAFGTGHHPTTRSMLEQLLNTPLEGRKVLDMGCGTGILAILCEWRGARSILAIDNDRWAVENAIRTIEKNGCERVRVEYGSELPWKGTGFDVILGNIQRDPLLRMIAPAAQALSKEGDLIMSGLRREDLNLIQERCKEEELVETAQKELDGWVMLAFQKPSE